MARQSNTARRREHQESARQKAAAMRVQELKRQRRRRLAVIVTSSVAVIAVIAVIVIVGVNSGSKKENASRTPAPLSLVDEVAGVPSATLDTIGAGTSSSPPKVATDPVYTANGKPNILFIGAEYCPYCAAERWALVQAMSRFGKFSNLSLVQSSANDVFPSTSTFSFYKSSYSSQYLSFTPVEDETVDRKALVQPTDEQTNIWTHYTGNPASFPFIYLAGSYAATSPEFDPGVLKGLTWQQIADALKDPTSSVAKAVDGAANVLTAALCNVTHDKPSNVCTAAGVTASAAVLKK